MSIAVQGQWDALSGQFAEIADRAGKFTVAVHGGGRVASSGVVWRAGIVVTASHMLRRSEDVQVTLEDKSRIKATVLGRDPGTDVAVLRFDGAHPEAISQFSKGESLRVGQLVMAVGRSTQGDLAASAGIIARLGGAWQSWRGGQIDALLRPDITLYPGQSGSALVDSQCRVLGINTSALARAAAITVPATTVDRVVGEILEHGGIFRPYLGLAMQPVAIPELLAAKLNVAENTALMVMQVEPSSPSAEAGIMLGDIIVRIGGENVSGIEQLQRALRKSKRGDSVELAYARGGQLATTKIKLADRPRS
jgi:serine protease DegQ